MKTSLNETLVELKLQTNNFRPNLNEVLANLKAKEIKYHQTKVLSLSENVAVNPSDEYVHKALNSSLNRLERLFSA